MRLESCAASRSWHGVRRSLRVPAYTVASPGMRPRLLDSGHLVRIIVTAVEIEIVTGAGDSFVLRSPCAVWRDVFHFLNASPFVFTCR